MTRASLIADFKSATTDLGAARASLANEQFRARYGMAHNLMHAAQVEHTIYHRWRQIGEALASFH